MKFSYDLNQVGGNKAELILKGYFDESAYLPMDINLSEISQISVDFSQIDFINSSGIKCWVHFADKLEQHPELDVVFKNCKRMVVDQINLIHGFLPKNARVESVFIPLFCNSCEKSFDVFHNVSKQGNNIEDIFRRDDAPKCKEKIKGDDNLEVDMIPDMFFNFLKKIESR